MPQRFDSYFVRVEGNEADRCHYPTRLDTYSCGCAHNCGYCYARALLDFRGLWNPVTPACAPPRDIRNTIARKLRPGEVVRLGGMTDCFQPIERGKRNTRRTIEWLNLRRVHYLIVTKSDLIAEYTDVLDPDLAHIQVSITSTDPSISKLIEPGAPVPEARITALETLAAAGYDVSVRLSPFVPEWQDLNRINAIACDKAIVEFLRVNTWIRRWLDNLGAGVDLSGHTLHHGGYDHLPLNTKRDILAGITGFSQISVCEDVPEHWEYWRDHFNANPDDCCNLRLK